MNTKERYELASLILRKTREFGAPLAGLTSVEALKEAPSARILPLVAEGPYVPPESPYGLKQGEIRWPADGRSVLVFAVPHPQSRPEMDWWYGQINPPGNNILKDISQKLKTWLNENYPAVTVYPLAYHVERGGVFLKDAARLAGLGTIGRNNLLVTAEYGSQVRLRAMIFDADLPVSGPAEFDPCADCEAYCLKACPQKSFEKTVLTPEQTGESRLPGRDGRFDRERCSLMMLKNEAEAEEQLAPDICDGPVAII
ncbi:epoxyqueuosine reductase, partial [Deltaproteobacteria bacterium OttesenSCG-928-M10]|nr:epoxyqueuosine reductase [Deltaproteobacteria bacterium OttesenSCG-928-M10]